MLDRRLGEQVRLDGALGADLWAALTNIEWRNNEGHGVSYSFREAGGIVAWVREEGSGVDWYWCVLPGVVADWIGDALALEGWLWTALTERDAI
jgi:hypothetical protein